MKSILLIHLKERKRPSIKVNENNRSQTFTPGSKHSQQAIQILGRLSSSHFLDERHMVCNCISSYVLPYTIIGYELIKLNLTIPLIQRDERQKRIIKLTVRDELRRKAKKRHRGRAGGGGGSEDGRERESRQSSSPEIE